MPTEIIYLSFPRYIIDQKAIKGQVPRLVKGSRAEIIFFLSQAAVPENWNVLRFQGFQNLPHTCTHKYEKQEYDFLFGT